MSVERIIYQTALIRSSLHWKRIGRDFEEFHFKELLPARYAVKRRIVVSGTFSVVSAIDIDVWSSLKY